MWVLRTPLTHKTTHKKLGWGFDALLQVLRIIVAEVGSRLIFIDDRQHKGGADNIPILINLLDSL